MLDPLGFKTPLLEQRNPYLSAYRHFGADRGVPDAVNKHITRDTPENCSICLNCQRSVRECYGDAMCPVMHEGKPSKRASKITIDETRARMLWERGYNDTQIAEILLVPPKLIGRWRRRNGLQARPRREK